MIFADKLIQLRKKSGWSQEELAEQMNVTRQSVSKWEGAQSIPDLDKILRLSQLFGVSTDYLLKDDIEDDGNETIIPVTEEQSTVRHVSMEEASAFLAVKERTAKPVAYATFLCILSPICLILLGGLSELPGSAISEGAASGIGMISLLVLVAIAVTIFISVGSKTSRYEYLEKEVLETAYGVEGMVKNRQENFRDTYTRYNIIGTCCCILSLVPLFTGIVINEKNNLFILCMMSCLFLLVGIGVTFFIKGGIIWASYEKLLQQGDYTIQKKLDGKRYSGLTSAYWLLATAIFLGYSFVTNGWGHSWIIWPVAGVLFPVVIIIAKALDKNK